MRFDIFFLLLIMAVIAVIDYKQQIIPDEKTPDTLIIKCLSAN